MESHNTTTQKVLEKIHSGEVAMRPRAFFVARVIAVVVLSVLIFVLTVGIAGFMSFAMRISGEEALLGFGVQGILMFFMVFPWGLFIVDMICVALLEVLLRNFSFGYRIPVLHLLFAILLGATFGGILLDRGAHVHDRIHDQALHGGVPMIGGLYRNAHRPPPPGKGTCRCVVIDITDNIVTVQTDDPRSSTSTFSIVLPPQGPATSSIVVGDVLFVAGVMKPDGFTSYGIRRIERTATTTEQSTP